MSTAVSNEAIKVLLVEDNPGDARLVQEILREDSPDQFDLICVERLKEAVVELAEDNIDVILLDLSLPDAAGLETITKMHNAAQNLPIIVLTGRSDETLGLQAMREGAQDYLLKHNLDSHLLKSVLRYASARRRADQAQRDSEERFRALVQNSTDVITILAADMTVLYESPSLEKVMGYKPEAVQGLPITDIIHPDDLPSVIEGVTNILHQPAATLSVEVRLRHADGSWRMQEATLTNLLDHPAIHGIVVNSRDITERKRSEEALRESEIRYHRVLDSLLEGAEIIGFDWRYLYVNDASAAHGRQSKDVLLRSTVIELYPGIENTDMFAVFRTCMEARTAQHFETEFAFPDGTKRWFDLSVQPIPEGIFILSLDITERKRAENAWRQYNRRLGVLHDIDRSILTAQTPQKIAERVAQSLAELIHSDAVRIIALDSDGKALPYLAAYPPTSPASQELMRQAVENYGLPESFHRGEVLLIDDTKTHDGLWVGFEEVLTTKGARSWIIAPLIAGEQLVGMLAVGSLQPSAFTSEHVEITREVTDQLAIALHKSHLDEQIQEHARHLEARVSERTKQLHSAKERIETILMSASDAMIVADLDGSIEQVNTAFTALFGYTLEQGRSVSLYSLLDSVSAATVRGIGAELAQGGQTQHVELVALRHDGTPFDAEAAFAPVVDGLPTILICSIRDITLRKRAERELHQAWAKEKQLNELKTRFVSMVSHDFRTPLASIQSSSDLLQNYSERMTDEKKRQHFTTINAQIKHLTGLLEDMLTITKADSVGLPFHPVLIDLGVFCQTIVDEMQVLAGTHQIRFTINRPSEQVRIDPDLLRRALVNLLSNAVKYSPEGGVAEFSVLIGDESIEIGVKDQGIGIPEDDQAHLFEVFHRAKNVGQISGTGLGLAIVKRSVEAHGGTITLRSEVGVGTTFTVRLPTAFGTG